MQKEKIRNRILWKITKNAVCFRKNGYDHDQLIN